MSDLNANGGHPASLSDVFGRVRTLETSVAKLDAGLTSLQSNVQRVENGQATILNAISSMKDKNADAGKPNYGVAISFAGLCFVIGGAILAAAVLPLKIEDAHLQAKVDNIEGILREDHDRVTRMEERDKLYRETGMIGVQRGN